MRHVLYTVVLSFGLMPSANAQQVAPAQVQVGTVIAERTQIAKSLEFVGRVEAINRVEIKARVTGYLDAVLFKEGDFVKENAPLYQIEKGLFEADVKRAEGALERAKSAEVLTNVQLERAEELLSRGTGTVVARDQALAADQQAKGAILQAEADLQSAKINLGYTDIVAPISGKIGRTNVTKGNVVGPNSGTLTTIVSQDPMYVTFPSASANSYGRSRPATGPTCRASRSGSAFRTARTTINWARSILSMFWSIKAPIPLPCGPPCPIPRTA